jgi:hypothetical protein
MYIVVRNHSHTKPEHVEAQWQIHIEVLQYEGKQLSSGTEQTIYSCCVVS